MYNNIKRKLLISFLTLFVLVLIYLFPTVTKYDVTLSYKEPVYNTVYLLNDNYLVETKVVSESNDIEAKIKDIIATLTINSPKSKYIDKNFKPLIPADTRILSLDLKDKLLKINFSKEFLNLAKDTEEKTIETIIFSLTKLDEVEKIMIFVEGEKLDKLPISGKTLPLELTKNYGINKVYNITDVFSTNCFTLYYYASINDEYHIVPVSMFSNNSDDKVKVIIEELKSAPIYQSNLMSFLSSNAKLLDYEIKENKIKLEFSSYILDNFFDEALIEEVKYAISESFRDTLGIDEVSFWVNNEKF